MLKKEYRLTKNKDFDKVFKEGRYYHNQNLLIKCLPNDLAYTRFGILVSTKVSKKAVVRNKIKRQIRAILALQLPFLKSGKDVVFVVFPLILAKEIEEIKKIIVTGFDKLNLYEKEQRFKKHRLFN